MLVQMLVTISGLRGDGRPWPRAGETIDLGEQEAVEQCKAGRAIPVPSGPPVEVREKEPEAPKPGLLPAAVVRQAPVTRPVVAQDVAPAKPAVPVPDEAAG